MWILRSDDGAEGGPYKFRMTAGRVRTIGRGPRADFVLDAVLVSRRHADRREPREHERHVCQRRAGRPSHAEGRRQASNGPRRTDRVRGVTSPLRISTALR